MLTWDCFLTYLLKIHEDLYQWNLYTLGWNLRVSGTRAKLQFEKTLFSQLLVNILFMDQYYITIRQTIPKIKQLQFPGTRQKRKNKTENPTSLLHPLIQV